MAGFSYDRYDRRRAPPSRSRSVFGFWVPFIVTTTLATGALAIWVLTAREENDTSSSSDDEDLSYGGDTDREQSGHAKSTSVSEGVAPQDSTLMGRVQQTIRRTPSPQQLFDMGSKRMAAGVAAAGAAVGGALSSIREDREDDFADHERWRDQSSSRATRHTGGRKRTVAVVVSADEGDMPLDMDDDKGWKSEHAVSLAS